MSYSKKGKKHTMQMVNSTIWGNDSPSTTSYRNIPTCTTTNPTLSTFAQTCPTSTAPCPSTSPHCRIVEEGIEYAWGLTKKYYHRIPYRKEISNSSYATKDPSAKYHSVCPANSLRKPVCICWAVIVKARKGDTM